MKLPKEFPKLVALKSAIITARDDFSLKDLKNNNPKVTRRLAVTMSSDVLQIHHIYFTHSDKWIYSFVDQWITEDEYKKYGGFHVLDFLRE